MADQITKNTVEHVALLSRLYLDDKEHEIYAAQLGHILSYIEKLKEVDVADVPPTSHVVPTMVNVTRPDEVKASLPVDAALANAPDRDGDFFRIPKVIEGK